jgi:hypothetical protein
MNRRAFSFSILRWGGLALASRCKLAWGQDSATQALPSSECDLQWLKKYRGKSTSAVVRDPRFKTMLERFFPATQVPFWKNCRVREVTFDFISIPGRVSVEHHRFVMIKGSLSHFARCRAMLWIDTHRDASNSQPTVTLLAIDVHGIPGTDFWAISNKDLCYWSPSAIPHNLRMNVARWIRSRRRKHEGYINRALTVNTESQTIEFAPEIVGIPMYRFEAAPEA